MFQIKMFRTVSRNGIENSINEFLKENSEKIEDVVDVKMKTNINNERKTSEYVGTIIYKIKN